MKPIRCALLLVVLSAVASAADSPVVPPTIDLDTALGLALEHNYAIRQARSRYAEATGSVQESRSGQLPTLSADAGYSRVDRGLLESPGGFPSGSPTSWSAGVQIEQTIYSGGAVESNIRAARAGQEAAAADFESAVRLALLNVREAYYGVLLARQQIAVREQAVRLLQEELTNAESRVRAGSGSPFDQLRAEVAVANGQPPLIRARNAYRLAAVDLLRIIGVPAEEDAEERVIGELFFDAREIDLEELLASAHEHRPELRQLENQVTVAKNLVEQARAGLRPNVGAVAGYGIQKSSFSDDLDDTVDGWTIGLQGRWNIFDGHATRGRVAQARARLRQAELSLQETALMIEADVRRAHSNLREARELVTASGRVVEQASESLRLARSRLNAGAATQLDVLQAQVALTDASTNAAFALHDANVAWARLQRAAALAPVPESARVAE